MRLCVNVCVSMCVSTGVHVCPHMSTCVSVSACVYTWLHACFCVSACMPLCIYVSMYVWLSIYVSPHVSMCVYMYVFACVCPCVSTCVCVYMCLFACMCPCVCVHVCVHCVWMDGDLAWGRTGRWQRLQGHWAQPLALPWGSDQSPISLMWETLVGEEETEGAERTSSSGGLTITGSESLLGVEHQLLASGAAAQEPSSVDFTVFRRPGCCFLLLFLLILENLITLLNVPLLGTSPCFIQRRW